MVHSKNIINCQKGAIAPIVVILILLAGLGVGVYLTQKPTNLKPKASELNQKTQIREDLPAQDKPKTNLKEIITQDEIIKRNTQNKLKKRAKVMVSGKLYDKLTLKPVGGGYKVCCDSSGKPVKVDINGGFSFKAKTGDYFSLFPPSIPGYTPLPKAINDRTGNPGFDSTYQLQIAGIDCSKSNYKDCLYDIVKFDLARDDQFDFEYIPYPPPAPDTF